MKRVLVLGAAGMAGHVVSLYLRENGFEVDTLSAHNKLDNNTTLLDVTDTKKLEAYLSKHTYDVVVNCIGLLIKQSEERKDLAVALNAYLPHYLENYYKDKKTKIIHLSTDCVFSGKNPPYKEDSWFDGELFYDRSKALGEIVNEKDLTFRMSIIGPDMQESGVGLFNWFYAQSGEIFGFTKAVWNGITTIELAKAIKAAIEQNLTGLYQLVPSGNITKYDLLQLFKKEFGRSDITIQPKDELALDKTLVNTRKDFDFEVAGYPDMIKAMNQWIKNHNNLYRHYKK
jgi:dTDP-4-dehydrorhamnose reductase